MNLRPVRAYPERAYPRASERLVKTLFVTASMTATSLGGCGPVGTERIDAGAQVHDLDATVNGPVADAPASVDGDAKPVDADHAEAASVGTGESSK